jgi:uncharacterized protein (TIGR03437 family)
MNCRFAASSLLCLAFAPAACLLAQTSIGSVACAPSNLNGTYEFAMNGRQVSSTGAVTKLFQATGSAVFDGQNKVTLNLTANVVNGGQSFGTPLVYAGTYSLQANCQGSISITSGDTATLTIAAYAINTTTGVAKSFYAIGSDSTYAYSGNGTVPAATCPVSALSGEYPFNANGNLLSGGNVTGTLVVLGAMQFDGKGNVTATWTASSNAATSAVTATGTYSLTAACLGSATLMDTAGNNYSFSLTLDSTAPDFAFAASTVQSIFSGSARKEVIPTGTTCNVATLYGMYELTLGGRALSSTGITTKLFQSNGSVIFDGYSEVTFTITGNAVNGSQSFANALVYSGTYTVQSNCLGTITLTTGSNATFALEAFSIDAPTQRAGSFQIAGSDSNYAYNGGGNTQPAECLNSSLSGAFPFQGTGNLLSGATDAGTLDVAGLFQFDGQGNVVASWTTASNNATTPVKATGTYTINTYCVGTATLTDAANNKYAVTLSAYGATAGGVSIVAANPLILFNATAQSVSTNPALAVVNAASNTASATPQGSIFTIYGTNLASAVTGATTVPLPTTLLTTTVTVNGESAPLFYASPTQINAQMPEDIVAGPATVIVTNGASISNAVAVTVPSSGTPGIFVYGQNRAVVVNANGSVNSTSAQAKVGDILVAYFTGGGPVQGTGLTTGAPTPSALPLTGSNSVTVGGKAATVKYIGLTPGSIGLYQLNFVVPTVTAGDQALVITVAGQASNGPLIAVSN